jgi:hypothetical protein
VVVVGQVKRLAVTRPRIPLPVARQLRQEAGFGCYVCGLPVVQYHDIVPYHEDDPYPVEEIMILCLFPRHDQATKGALTVDQQGGEEQPLQH